MTKRALSAVTLLVSVLLSLLAATPASASSPSVEAVETTRPPSVEPAETSSPTSVQPVETSSPPSGKPVETTDTRTATDTPGVKDGLAVGFNGRIEQIAQIDHFYGDEQPRLCHWYVGWSVAVHVDGRPLHPAGWEGNRAWLANAQASGCDEVLVSFKALSLQDPPEEFDPEPPTVEEYTAAFREYLTTDWAAVAGYTGSFAFTAWNEPNLNSNAGNGYPQPTDRRYAIDPRLAARYYLAASSVCRPEGCRVAAMNFGSNGNGEADHQTNCATVEVPRDQLCARTSVHAAPGAAPSYLDLYRNEIANAGAEFGLGIRYRPPLVAYHGWADSNTYLRGTRTCTSYDDCLLEKVLYAWRGSWSGELWNTEDGIGQPGFFTVDQITDPVHAEGIAYTMRLADRTPRYTRLYWTHLIGSPSRLLITNGTTVTRERPGLCVLQRRLLTYDRTVCPG